MPDPREGVDGRRGLAEDGGAVVFTLLLAIVAGGGFIALHFFADALLFLYVWALVQYQREVEQARQAILQPTQTATLDYAATGTERL